MRLIDADAFGNRLYHEVFEKDSEDQRWDSGCWMRYRLFEKVLREQPTVEQPERKTGKWETEIRTDRLNGVKYVVYACSLCGIACPHEYNFCPNCGAEMEVSE